MKRPSPLATIIAPVPLRYFGEDPPAGGDNAGGGGDNAAGGGNANADIMDFEAPDIGNVGDILNGKVDGDPLAAKPPAAKPPAAKPTTPPKTTPDPAKPGAAPTVEPPAKQLRAELDAVKKERDELKEYREKGDPKLVAAEMAVKEKEKELAAARERATEYERKLALADPAVTQKLRALDDGYNKDAGKFYSAVPELDSSAVNELVTEFHALPRNKPAEYKAARLAFEAKVNAALGGSEEVEHRKLGKALDFIERTHEFALERPQVEQEIHSSAQKLKYDSEVTSYTKAQSAVRERLAKAKEVPDDLRAQQPYHPRVMLDTFAKAMTPEQTAEIEKGIPEYIELVTAGVRPRTDADFAGMSPKQISDARAEEQARLEIAKEALPDVLSNGLRALRLFPVLVKEYQRMRAKLGEDKEAAPPDPTAAGGGGTKDGGDDLREFKMPNIPNF